MPDERKRTQRQRLLNATVYIAVRDGYEAAAVARVIEHAGVSRATFYEYFSSREDAFLAAIHDVQGELCDRLSAAVDAGPPADAAAAAITALVEFAAGEPMKARVLMSEVIAAGPKALELRDQGITALASIVESTLAQADGRSSIPDFPLAAVLGAIHRMLALRLRREEPLDEQTSSDLRAWVAAYERPAEEQRWRRLSPGPRPPRSEFVAPAPLAPPPPLRGSRTPPSTNAAADYQRQRFIFATAETISERGYLDTSIAEIVRRAGVDRRAFYRHFADKQDAFMGVFELVFQSTMAATAGAFVGESPWPQRVWDAGRAFTHHLEQNPLLTRVALVESGAAAAQYGRIQTLIDAFTIFLQDGYDYHPTHPPSRLALEAIAATNFEIAYLQARRKGALKLTGLLGHLAYMSLAPFLGAKDATGLLSEKGTQTHR